jgi:hypothetical protein
MVVTTMQRKRAVPAEPHAPADSGRPAFARTALAFGLFVGAALLVASGTTRAATYKWVDEKGVVHYTDKIPPEAVDKASIELNKQGVPVNRTEKALTPEQRRANEQEAVKAKEAARAQEEIDRRDRALVSSYTSEAEIDLARNRSLQTINNVISSSQAFSEQLTKRKVDVEEKKAQSAGKPVVAVLDRELESIETELARQADLIAQKQKEVVTITAKYDADKQRWRELVAAKAAPPPVKSAPPVQGSGAAVVPVGGTAKK